MSGDKTGCEISAPASASLNSQTVSLPDPAAAAQTLYSPHTLSFFPSSPSPPRFPFVLYFSRLPPQLSLCGRRSMARRQVRPGTAATGFTQTPRQLQMWPFSGGQVRSAQTNTLRTDAAALLCTQLFQKFSVCRK